MSHKIALPKTGESSKAVLPTNNHETEEYDENVEALKKLLKTKTPSAQTIQDLLKSTRELRLKWLSSAPVSLHDILQKYPVFEHPKWVSVTHICSFLLVW